MSNEVQDSTTQLPRFHPILVTSLVLFFIGVIGLVLLLILTLPTLGPRWLLYFLVTLAGSGLALPVAFYLHKRFPSIPSVGSPVLIREAVFFGAYVDVLLWLQFGRVLNFALAVFIAVGLVAVELIIRWRERSRFTPVPRNHE